MLLESPQALRPLIGRPIGVTEWMLLTEERIQQFAEVTDDRQWIHLDRERARRESPYGTTVAHGFLTLSLLSTGSPGTLGRRDEHQLRFESRSFSSPRVGRCKNPRPFHAAVRGGSLGCVGSRSRRNRRE